MKKLIVLALGLFLMLGVQSVDAKLTHAAGIITPVESTPTYMSVVHFNYVYPNGLKDCKNAVWWNCAYTRVICFQGSTQVWFSARPSYFTNGFLLGSPDTYNVWQQLGGGATDCVATLFEYSHSNPAVMTDHASVTFHVGP